MKHNVRIILALFLGISITTPALATSGACSGHGGVNCGAGPDTDGSVICIDGWTNSSVQYSTMQMCAPIVVTPVPSPAPFSPPLYQGTIQPGVSNPPAAPIGVVTWISSPTSSLNTCPNNPNTCLTNTTTGQTEQFVIPTQISLPPISNNTSTITTSTQPVLITAPVVTLVKKTVLTIKRINIRSLPSLKGKIISITTPGRHYDLVEERKDWVKVQFGTKSGWVLKSLTKISTK